ncbi:MAG: amidohydrolase family protein, partial [bacterium]|nr:amidohydrolase family protein [bacterium]
MKQRKTSTAILISALILTLFYFSCSISNQVSVEADLVLTNGKIITIDERESVAEAVAVKFGKILAVGTTDEINMFTGSGTQVIDLGGKTVIPGLMDSHCHITSTSMSMIGVMDLSEEAGVTSIADIQAKIREKVSTTPKGEGIYGAREDDFKLSEKRHPTRWELDEAAPDHPVLISTVGGHFSITNSKGFELAGITKSTPDPAEGEFD